MFSGLIYLGKKVSLYFLYIFLICMPKIIIFPFDQLEALKVMPVDQLNTGKKRWVDFTRVQRKKNYLTDTITQVGP